MPDCAATHLAFDPADDVWQGTFDVPAGDWQYKAALNNSWTENYGANAQNNGGNISLNLGAAASVKFYYSHETHWITSNKNAVIATAPGSFQHFLGCPGDWQPDCLRSWLQDPDGDGIYSFPTTLDPGRQLRGEGRDQRELGRELRRRRRLERRQHPVHRRLRLRRDGLHLQRLDPRAHRLAGAGGGAPQPASVTIPGSFQSEVGCPDDWQPDCANTHLTSTRPTASGRGRSTSRPATTSTRPPSTTRGTRTTAPTRSRAAPTSASTSPRPRRSSSITITPRTG